MAKRLVKSGTMCTYCAVVPAVEEEHVFPLRLIPKDERNRANQQLIRVPSCGKCNDRKRVVEETLAHVLLGDTGDFDQHTSAIKLLMGPFQNAALSNNSRVLNAIGSQLDSAPVLWLPSRDGWEEMTLLKLPDQLALERLEAVEFIAKGLLNHAYGIVIPQSCNVSVRAANYLERASVGKLKRDGRVPIDQRLVGSIGDRIVAWFGAAVFSKPDHSDLRAIIGIDFYGRSFYFANIEPGLSLN